MNACVMGFLRLVRRVMGRSSTINLAAGRLRLRGLASLYTLALLGATGLAHAQTPYPNPQDDYYCRVMGFECVKPTPQAPHQYNFVDYPSGGGSVSVPRPSEAESRAAYIAYYAPYACTVNYTDLPWLEVSQPPINGRYQVGASCAGQPGDGGWISFSLGLETFHIVCQTRLDYTYPKVNDGNGVCNRTRTVLGYKARWTNVSCPPGFGYTGGNYCYRPCNAPGTMVNGACHCPPGMTQDVNGVCRKYVDRYFDKPRDACPTSNPPAGNPIYPLTGVKRQEVDLGIVIGKQRLALVYDTRVRIPSTNGARTWLASGASSFGPLWQSTVHKQIVLQSTAGAGAAFSGVAMQRGGSWSTAGVSGFSACGSGGGGGGSMVYAATTEPGLKLDFTSGVGQLLDAQGLTLEGYDTAGKLLSVTSADGSVLSHTYSDGATPTTIAPAAGLLIGVQDSFGRSVQFRYEQPAGVPAARVNTIIDPEGRSILAAYDGQGNLQRLTWADGTVRTFVYERTDLPWALTGVVDENNRRHSTYGYDNVGRATSTELAGGVDRFEVSYAPFGAASWSVTETLVGDVVCRDHRWKPPTGTVLQLPSGQANNLDASLQNGTIGLTSQSQPAGSGCAASTSSQAYDTNGNVNRLDDFNGNRSCLAYDSTRSLRTIALSGLTNTTPCPADLASYVPNLSDPATPQRKLTTAWHPDWNLVVKQAEPGRITTRVYNGQPDPFNGNTVASCAPVSATLPDGKPIAVLCKQVEQATTDVHGGSGFSAALQAGVPNRVTTWTYNQHGQVLTENGPRTDVNDTTIYAYYSDTTADHLPGDLATVTNAAGRVTQFTRYNRHGQLLQSADPNGAITTYTYDHRQKLLSSTAGTGVTTYTYDAAGQLKRVNLPDASWIGFDYDDAHRQVAAYDHLGNRIDYQLDNSGHRTGEITRDSGGALNRQLSRSIDALGRVQQTTGRP